MNFMSDIHVFKDSASVAAAAADVVVTAAREAIGARGAFTLVLSGGSTPKLLYQLLTAEPFRSQIYWKRWEFYFGDERTVPPDHAESNYRMASAALLSKAPIDPPQVHRIKGEGDPMQSAIEYGKMLKARFGNGGPDVTLLGMGDDGHTASLFPFTPALEETHHRCTAQFVEKSTTGANWRITLTAPFINRSARVLALVTGASKAARLREVLKGPADTRRLPIQLIQPTSGKMLWMLDEAAAAHLA